VYAIDGVGRWYAAGGGGYGTLTGGSAGDGVGSGGIDASPQGSNAPPRSGSGGCGSMVAPGGAGGSGVVIVRIRR
jgi:hypothetical protein